MPSTSVNANTVATQSAAIPVVEGYEAIGIVGANSWHGQIVHQAFELSDGKIIITLRNLSNSKLSTTGKVRILYARATAQ